MKWIGTQTIYNDVRIRGSVAITNTNTSSATEGGLLSLVSNDGAAMGDDHRLGGIIFRGAEDANGTLKTGASIHAFADAAWSGSENGTRLEFYTMDGDASSELSLTLDSDLLATFAGAVTVTGALTGTLATVSQPNVTTLAGLTSFGSAGATTDIAAGDLTMYNAVNDGNPTFSIGSSATERLEIKAEYESGAQGLDVVRFTSFTEGSSANDARYAFEVDDVNKFIIKDGGIQIVASGAFEIGSGNAILSDSSGTTTLSNIDALDATTIATIETAMEANLDTLPGLILDGDKNITPSLVSGSMLHLDTSTLTDNNTASEGTADGFASVILEGPTVAASNDVVTITDAATLYIPGTPEAGANMTLTNAYALWVDAGNARFDGNVEAASLTVGGTNVLTGSLITTLGTISAGVWQGTAIASAYIADDAVTFAKASGVTPNVYGSTIKLLPSDFQANIDGGNTKFGVGYADTAGSAYGMKVANSATELYAFVSIPEGMKATHVDIYDKDDLAIEVFEVQINATTMTSKGSGNCNTTLDITDVNATATNFLAILITTTATTNKIFGGKVTIAAQ